MREEDIWEPVDQKVKKLRLMEKVPNSVYSRLIIRYPYQRDDDYAMFYFDSAERLASTFKGDTVDDQILIPFLLLYRHGFELLLKASIRELIRLRSVYLGHDDPDISDKALNERLEKVHGHKLYPLLNEVKQHWKLLDPGEEFPKDVEQLISMLHEMDRSGLAFRYSGSLPDYQDYVDFPDLAALLEDGKVKLYSAMDYITEGYAAMPTLSELM